MLTYKKYSEPEITKNYNNKDYVLISIEIQLINYNIFKFSLSKQFCYSVYYKAFFY